MVFYEQLSKALGPDQPFYAFQSPLLFNADTRETSIEELASIYVKELRAFSPEGPYILGGLSFGGLVAFEMAQQLYAQGVGACVTPLVRSDRSGKTSAWTPKINSLSSGAIFAEEGPLSGAKSGRSS